jgi:hypothetical protein
MRVRVGRGNTGGQEVGVVRVTPFPVIVWWGCDRTRRTRLTASFAVKNVVPFFGVPTIS